MADISIRIQTAIVTCVAILLAACTGGVHQSSSNGTSGSVEYTVGGTVSGLSGSGLVLASNTGELLPVTGDGSFTFKTTFPSGNPYYVLVLTQPSTPTQTCLATNGAGTVQNTNITGITVVCNTKTTPTDAIGGVVIGLTGSGLVLQNHGPDTLAVAADGAFTFPTSMPSGSQYNVSVLTPPINPYEDCVVLNGKGMTGDSDIANIAIACTVNVSPSHTIGGTVTGVSGTLVLENNGRDDLTITADGSFKFPLAIPSGSSYSVTTKSATGGLSQACTFTNATGIVGDSDITNVTVVCTANVGLQASVSGLSGTGLVLQNTVDGDNLAVSANGIATFPAGVANGASYNVTVAAQPTNPSQTCVVANGTGTAPAGSAINVTCTINSYTVSGVVTGLPDPNSGASFNLVLQDNGGDNYTIAPTSTSPVAFTFATPVASGSAYSVTVFSQPGLDTSFGAPVTQTSTVCVVASGTGTVTNGNVTNVVVNCVRPAGFAYVTNSGDNTVTPYIIDSATGTLLQSGPPLATGTKPSNASTDGNNSFLYVTNSGSNDLSGYTINANTGALTPLPGSPFAAGLSAPSSIASFYSSTGDGMYVTNAPTGGAGSITAFTVDTTGTSLTNIAGSPFTAQAGATAGIFAFGSGVNYFYLEADSANNTVSVYTLDTTTGTLTPNPASPFATGTRPNSIATINTIVAALQTYVDFAYVANSGDGTISAYSMENEIGTLTPLTPATVTAGAGLSALATSGTSGIYLYATTALGVLGYSINTTTGALTPVPNGPFAAGTGPGPIATMNNFVYVINTVDRTVSVFVQDPNTGALTPVAGPAPSTGQAPSSIVVMSRPAFG